MNRQPGVTIGTDVKVSISGTEATCSCGWTSTQTTTDRAITVGEWHLKGHIRPLRVAGAWSHYLPDDARPGYQRKAAQA